MSRLFISHSSRNNDSAIALKDWLIREGWSGPDDLFLDLDPVRGIAAGQRWATALEEAATRCEAVLFLVSEHWLASKWCCDEYQLANRLNKKLFALLVDDVALDRLPGGLTAQWQVVRLAGEPADRFVVLDPQTQTPSPVYFSKTGLQNLRHGLEKAGIGAETFELEPDAKAPFGWRAPYRGLEALEPADAAVFFGRGADIVRGIDALRGLAARHPPRLMVLLGASGSGKSSFLRAGLWRRLARDDSQWLPLRTIRAGHDGAIEGSEGLLSALEDVHQRFALRSNRADLRQQLAAPEPFMKLLRGLREAAAKRAHITSPPYPLPVICLDQGEELFGAGAKAESGRLLQLAREAILAGEALLLVTIRSDAFGLMQIAKSLEGITPIPLSLGAVPSGEIADVIRGPSEVLRRKAGPQAPTFDAAVVERLQAEIAGERDALPLLAFVLQRLTREYTGKSTIGLVELDRSGGVAAAIEAAAESALTDAGIAPERAQRREALRRLFIPHLARIDRESKAPQRRVAPRGELPADLAPLVRALTERRLLVVKRETQMDGVPDTAEPTLEVAHEALLRQWPMLAELLQEDRDALLLLDGVLSAAMDWDRADVARRADFLAHRGSRLLDSQALAARGANWERQIVPARAYLAACQIRDDAEREEKEALLAREQARLEEVATVQARTALLQRRGRRTLVAMALLVVLGLGLGVWQYRNNLARQTELDRGQVNLIAELATTARLRSDFDSALRLSIHAVDRSYRLEQQSSFRSIAPAALAAATWEMQWRQVFADHQDFVYSAVFSPDGSRIVTASDDKTARIWDTATGKEITVFRGHDGGVWGAAFSPDGARIVTASEDKTARIWDVVTAKEIVTTLGHDDAINSAAFSPDGRRVVTASADKTARVWDALTGKELAVLRGHSKEVNSAVFSPNGRHIVTASDDNTVRIWDSATAKQIAALRGHAKAVRYAAYSSDGSRIVTASSDNTARIWDATTAKEIGVMRGHAHFLMSAAFSSDGSRVVTASLDRTVRIWDVATTKEIAVLRGHGDTVGSAVFSPDGLTVLTASRDKTARIWNAIARKVEVLRGHDSLLRRVAFSPDGRQVVTASDDATARIWDVASAKEITVLRGHEEAVRSATFSPDGTRIVTASDDRTVRIWNTTTAKEIAVLKGHKDIVRSADFSPDGLRIVTASEDKTARIWDAITAKEIAVLSGHKDLVRSAAFSPDGARIVTASDDNTARVWDAVTEREIAVLQGHDNWVSSGSFSPDGSRIITTSGDQTARVWQATTAKEIAILRGHENSLFFAAFSPDGQSIVTASSDNTARIWSVATAKEIVVLRGHDGFVNSAAFSPDGNSICTASNDNTARLWDVHFITMPTKQLVSDICHRMRGITALTENELRLIGYPDGTPEINVCAEIP